MSDLPSLFGPSNVTPHRTAHPPRVSRTVEAVFGSSFILRLGSARLRIWPIRGFRANGRRRKHSLSLPPVPDSTRRKAHNHSRNQSHYQSQERAHRPTVEEELSLLLPSSVQEQRDRQTGTGDKTAIMARTFLSLTLNFSSIQVLLARLRLMIHLDSSHSRRDSSCVIVSILLPNVRRERRPGAQRRAVRSTPLG
jgi:hypothetical protein